MIPEKIHFTYGLDAKFGGKPFSMVHYIAIKSAAERNPDCELFLWYDHPSHSRWWDLACGLCETRQIAAPKEVFGRKLNFPEHRADVLRLRILRDEGGIYLDCDTLCLKPFADLRKNKVVINQDGKLLSNAVILAERGAEFVCAWLDEYKTFRSVGRDLYLHEHGTVVPTELSRLYRVKILPPGSVYSPNPAAVRAFILGKDESVAGDAYCAHFKQLSTWTALEQITPEWLASSKSEYARLASPCVPRFITA